MEHGKFFIKGLSARATEAPSLLQIWSKLYKLILVRQYGHELQEHFALQTNPSTVMASLKVPTRQANGAGGAAATTKAVILVSSAPSVTQLLD